MQANSPRAEEYEEARKHDDRVGGHVDPFEGQKGHGQPAYQHKHDDAIERHDDGTRAFVQHVKGHVQNRRHGRANAQANNLQEEAVASALEEEFAASHYHKSRGVLDHSRGNESEQRQLHQRGRRLLDASVGITE